MSTDRRPGITARAQDLKAAGVAGTTDALRARAYLEPVLGIDTRPAPEPAPAPGPQPQAPAGQPAPAPAAPAASAAAVPCRPRPRASRPGAAAQATARPGSRARPARATAAQAARTRGPAAAAKINLTIPLTTLLGLADHPGEAAGFGPIDAALARDLAARAAAAPATTWCVTITDRRRPPHRPRLRPTQPASRKATAGGHQPRPPGNRATSPRPARPPGPPAAGIWRLRPVPGHPGLAVTFEPVAVTGCDHRHQTPAHDPGARLRHLVQIRDPACTWPACRRTAENCDFEHTMPWEQGGPTCSCNTGPRCRHHHHAKQAPGWQLTQDPPGYHTWTTPAGRTYTTGPATYPT